MIKIVKGGGAPEGGWAPERATPPEGGVAALPTTSAGGDFGDNSLGPRSLRVVSLCGRGAGVAMRGR